MLLKNNSFFQWKNHVSYINFAVFKWNVCIHVKTRQKLQGGRFLPTDPFFWMLLGWCRNLHQIIFSFSVPRVCIMRSSINLRIVSRWYVLYLRFCLLLIALCYNYGPWNRKVCISKFVLRPTPSVFEFKSQNLAWCSPWWAGGHLRLWL